EVPAFLVAELRHAPEKVAIERRLPWLHADKSDAQLRRLLRARRARPNEAAGSRDAKERDELAASDSGGRTARSFCDESTARHSITSSARASRSSGMVNPSALAVRMLMTNSKWVGCSTGRSAGCAPLRILST